MNINLTGADGYVPVKFVEVTASETWLSVRFVWLTGRFTVTIGCAKLSVVITMKPEQLLYKTCYDVFTRRLRWEKLTDEYVASTVALIQSWQVARTGFFEEHGFRASDDAFRSRAFYSIEQSHLCLSALSELGAKPKHDLRAMNLIAGHAAGLQTWLSHAQWWLLWPPPPATDSKLRDQGDWLGEELFHFGGTLCYAALTEQCQPLIVLGLQSWLERQCDKTTGLWGTQHGCSRERCLTGSVALVRLFYHMGWALPASFSLLEALELAAFYDFGGSDGTGQAAEESEQARYYRQVALALREPKSFRLWGVSAMTCWQAQAGQSQSSGSRWGMGRSASASTT